MRWVTLPKQEYNLGVKKKWVRLDMGTTLPRCDLTRIQFEKNFLTDLLTKFMNLLNMTNSDP